MTGIPSPDSSENPFYFFYLKIKKMQQIAEIALKNKYKKNKRMRISLSLQ
jgi:hypothetical protein